MKLKRILLPLLLLCAAAPANALVLRGIVTDVPDGKSIVIFSNNRKLTVVLEGVEAPELKQEFGDVARQHLESLILNKPVEVEFSEIQPGHVVGRVTCNKLDIGLQVIRDGAAWYDRREEVALTDVERGVYADAEQSARNEQRGIWQDGTPMPPWEWRRAEAAKRRDSIYKKGNGRALQREDRLFSRSGPAANFSGSSNVKGSWPKPSAKPLNTPGEDYDFTPYLRQGRWSVVYFYADWCPACRRIAPAMDQLNARPAMQVLFMNIRDWGSSLAQQYDIHSVPYLKIYDRNGALIAEGKTARAWLDQIVD